MKLRRWALFLLASALLMSAACEPDSPIEQGTVASQPGPLDQKLFDAIRKGNAKEVKRLLEKGASATATEANDWPAIVVGAGESLEIVKLLLAKGAKVNAQQSDEGWTPLIQAITHHRSDVVLYLLSKGADPSLSMNDGATPLHMAVRWGDVNAVEALLKRKVDVNARTREEPNAVHNPVADKQVAEVFEPGYRFSGRTPLFEMAAAFHERKEMVKLLLAAGADLKAADDNGWTLLHEAAKHGADASVGELLKLGLDPNARSRQEFTPLHVAVRAGFGIAGVPLIKRLLTAGADAGARNKQGQTPEDLLRADAARLFARVNLSPSASAASASMRSLMQLLNEALRALHPGAEPIEFPEAPKVRGWSIYPPMELDTYSGESRAKIERRVKTESGRTLLALTYNPEGEWEWPPALRIDDLELNTYEPLAPLPFTLEANRELLVAFPREAGSLGGAVRLDYSYKVANGSGSGQLGDAFGSPNPTFTQQDTPKGREIAVYCHEIQRPLELRIDRMTVGGKELAAHRGKILVLKPLTTEPDPRQNVRSYATPLATIKKGQKGYPQVSVTYSYRLVGNKKWRKQTMPLLP